MVFKKFGDLITGVFFLVLAVVMFVMASQLPPSLMGGLGSDFMPKVLSVGTAILALFQIRSGIVKMRSYTAQDAPEEYPPEYARVLATIASFIAYVCLMKPVGFLLTSAVYLFVQMLILAPKEKRNYLLFAVISVVFSVVVYFVFRNALNVMLPAGILG